MVNRSHFSTFSEILANTVTNLPENQNVVSEKELQFKAEQEWRCGIFALNDLLRQQTSADDSELDTCQGVILSGPSPMLLDSKLLSHFASQIFINQSAAPWEKFLSQLQSKQPRLLPTSAQPASARPVLPTYIPMIIPFPGEELLVQQPFCVALTHRFSVVLVLGETSTGESAFMFSFEPQLVHQSLNLLEQRLQTVASVSGSTTPPSLAPIKQLWQKFPVVAPDYQVVTQFSRLMLHRMSLQISSATQQSTPEVSNRTIFQPLSCKQATSSTASSANSGPDSSPQPVQPHAADPGSATRQTFDLELLQAIAHEVRTPLTTIRTLARLLLKRRKFDPDAIRREIEKIDQECTTQIDRFDFIFRAAELELSRPQSSQTQAAARSLMALTPTSLMDVFQNNLPRWQQQAHQRNHTLEIDLPQKLPFVVSNPTLLNQVLTGVMENFTRSLPHGSHIQLGVSLAGHQLKLQLESQLRDDATAVTATPQSPLKSVGPLLMFQPETGVLSLNLTATKSLFQALGGKLVVRQKPEQRKVMTIFLPLKS